MTTLFRSQTLAFLPNSPLKTPIVPGPHTSCVIRMSAFTQILSPAFVRDLPAARARIFSVNVIQLERLTDPHCLCNSGIRGRQPCGDSLPDARRTAYQSGGFVRTPVPAPSYGCGK